MLEDTDITRGVAGKYVDTYAFTDGRLDIRWRGLSLPYKMFDMDQCVTHAAIVENKRLCHVLAFIKEQQERRPQPRVKSNSKKNGYKPNGRKPGRRIDIINDPVIIAHR